MPTIRENMQARLPRWPLLLRLSRALVGSGMAQHQLAHGAIDRGRRARPPRHEQSDPPPMRRRPHLVSRRIDLNPIALAIASLPVRARSMSADEIVGIRRHEPPQIPAAVQPSNHGSLQGNL